MPTSWNAVVMGPRHQHGVINTMTWKRFTRTCGESTCMVFGEKKEKSLLLVEKAGLRLKDEVELSGGCLLIWGKGNGLCKGWAARESTVPWGSHIIFGLFRAEEREGPGGGR